jgi:hypothetical protein
MYLTTETQRSQRDTIGEDFGDVLEMLKCLVSAGRLDSSINSGLEN